MDDILLATSKEEELQSINDMTQEILHKLHVHLKKVERSDTVGYMEKLIIRKNVKSQVCPLDKTA